MDGSRGKLILIIQGNTWIHTVDLKDEDVMTETVEILSEKVVSSRHRSETLKKFNLEAAVEELTN